MKGAKPKSYDVPYILDAHNILKKDPGRQLTITALALEVGLDASKLRRGFKEVFHQTIHQYRLDLRLKLALTLLEETDLTIAEIAYKSGFDSRDGFARRFRKKYRCSPREWRKDLHQPSTQWEQFQAATMLIVPALN
jgi:AraC-like DNA-binding protein